MNWFFIALLSTICFSSINLIDKYLISKYLKDIGTGAILLFSSLFAFFVLPVIYLIDSSVLEISTQSALILILVGILSFIAIAMYFKALMIADVSIVVAFFQLIPVFGFILGYYLLGELISTRSIVAGITIIFGILILSFERKNNSDINFKKIIFLLMLGSSFTYALYETMFKVMAINEAFWTSLFWQNVGLLSSGILMYVFAKSYREELHLLIKKSGRGIFGLNVINEILNTFAVGFLQYATLLAPITLVMLVNSLQPAVVFIIAITLTIFFPNLIDETIDKRTLARKIMALAIILVGTYLLYT